MMWICKGVEMCGCRKTNHSYCYMVTPTYLYIFLCFLAFLASSRFNHSGDNRFRSY